MRTRFRAVVTGVALVLVAPACGSDGGVAPPRERTARFTLSVTTPNTGDGGLQLTISSSATSLAGVQVVPGSPDAVAFLEPVGTGTARVVVIGRIASGLLATLVFPSAIDPTTLILGTVDEAASGDDFSVRSSLAGYTVRFAPAAP